jgi:hypothetical protein
MDRTRVRAQNGPKPAAVDVAGQHQQVGAGRRLRGERFGFEVQVRQQLDAHRRSELVKACIAPALGRPRPLA